MSIYTELTAYECQDANDGRLMSVGLIIVGATHSALVTDFQYRGVNK